MRSRTVSIVDGEQKRGPELGTASPAQTRSFMLPSVPSRCPELSDITYSLDEPGCEDSDEREQEYGQGNPVVASHAKWSKHGSSHPLGA